jgi:hypothetical protein
MALYNVDSQGIREAGEVVELYRLYETAQYGFKDMWKNAQYGIDMNELPKYAQTDRIPLRIKGNLHITSEAAGYCVIETAPMMEGMYSVGVADARLMCINCIEYIVTVLRTGPIMIKLGPEARSTGMLSLYGYHSGLPEKLFHFWAVQAATLALGIKDFDPDVLEWEPSFISFE